ncbi:MAG: hydroxymethylbilane synthase [Gemmatimonadaceae bacterium]
MGTYRVGTRGSALALRQTGEVVAALRSIHPQHDFVLQRIATRGDVLADAPLAAIGRGAFVDAIEQSLREGEIDLAVHSAKDLPSTLDADLRLGAVLRRADPRDCSVSRSGLLAELPAGARVGTSSARRACQLTAQRPDLAALPLRGNVDTRLRRLDAGDFDAILLAMAGLVRLSLESRATEVFDPLVMLPCPGQGALAVEIRSQDAEVAGLVAPLADAPTTAAVGAERAFLARLGAGCAAPVGAYAQVDGAEGGGGGGGGALVIHAFIGAIDGRMLQGSQHGSVDAAALSGTLLAEELLARGGAALLREAAHEAEYADG